MVYQKTSQFSMDQGYQQSLGAAIFRLGGVGVRGNVSPGSAIFKIMYSGISGGPQRCRDLVPWKERFWRYLVRFQIPDTRSSSIARPVPSRVVLVTSGTRPLADARQKCRGYAAALLAIFASGALLTSKERFEGPHTTLQVLAVVLNTSVG